jgi:hypothetical protein
VDGAKGQRFADDATIVTLDPSNTIIPRGDLVIDGERLASVGPPDEARRADQYEWVLDAYGTS